MNRIHEQAVDAVRAYVGPHRVLPKGLYRSLVLAWEDELPAGRETPMREEYRKIVDAFAKLKPK